MPAPAAATRPRIYSLPTGGEPAACIARAGALGFSHLLAPASWLTAWLGADEPVPVEQTGLAPWVAQARAEGLRLLLDVDLGELPADAPIRAAQPGWFHAVPSHSALPDPRRPVQATCARWRLHDEAVAAQALPWWTERLGMLADAGVAGFRLRPLDAAPPAWWTRLVDALHARAPGTLCLAWTQGQAPETLAGLAASGFDFSFCSAEWWDYRAGWLARELERLRAIAPVLACAAPPAGGRSPHAGLAERGPWERAQRRVAWLAAACGAGWLMPAGFERGAEAGEAEGGLDLDDEVRAINAWLADRDAATAAATPTLYADDGWAGLWWIEGGQAWLLLINAHLDREVRCDPAALGGGQAGAFAPWSDAHGGDAVALPLTLAPGEVRLLRAPRARPVAVRTSAALTRQALQQATAAPRIAIESVAPCIDDGRFPVKRVVGDAVRVEADVFMDGHDRLAACLRWRACDERQWHEQRMEPIGNDRYAASFTPGRIGRYEYAVQAWRDSYASYRHEVVAKHDAGLAIPLELEEGRRLVEAFAGAAAPAQRKPLRAVLAAYAKAGDDEARYRLLTAPELAPAMAAADPRPFAAESAPLRLEVDRRAAQFASWYELFPRSITDDASRHGTFRDVIGRLPAIQAMGFDVLYFPPIHPIGRAFRKGPNNTLEAGEHDPGSPYAIGAAEGGHTAIHPELGTLEDFRALRDAAHAHGLELALDFAIQCSPDHPWLGEHPEWFDWRPDGSLRYAENPPKKYQDIVNVDFYTPGAVPSLWQALCDVVLFWAGEGVRTFRVDNPHTKPFPFWEWLIARVRGQYPDTLFLSEAFTRPKPMYRLAKAGFSQSYTYFTWRHTKQEFTDYLTELTQGPPRDFFRPHFFVNTPDINPYFLQHSGRSGFLIRAALATTLSGLWGMYSGFELCEGTPIPGKEEYLDSEKYEIKPRDWEAPGNIIAEITRLNAIRREQPALQSHLHVRFLQAEDPHVLFFEKTTPQGTGRVLVAINLDPHHAHGSNLHLPLGDWGLAWNAAVTVEDLLHDTSATWHGPRQHVWLGQGLPYAIWRVEA